jgi:hypothetical protein
MNTLESQVAQRLHGLVDGLDGDVPASAILRRGQRARRQRHTLTVVAASVALLAVGGGVALAELPSTATHSPNAIGAQAPPAGLDAILTATRSTTYRVYETIRTRQVSGAVTTVTGAYDPATVTGFLHQPADDGPGFYEERLVHGVRYNGDAGTDKIVHWHQVPGTFTGLDYANESDSAIGGTGDPTALLRNLTRSGATVTKTGADTYHFVFVVPAKDLEQYALSDTYAGDITVGPDSRVAGITFDRAVHWFAAGKPDRGPVDILVTIKLSDYGSPVKVEVPAIG